MSAPAFTARLLGGPVEDPGDANADVEVELADGSRWGATVFTPRNLETLRARYRSSGECAGGLYLWARHMILVEAVTEEVLRRVVEDLLESGELDGAFERFEPGDCASTQDP